MSQALNHEDLERLARFNAKPRDESIVVESSAQANKISQEVEDTQSNQSTSNEEQVEQHMNKQIIQDSHQENVSMSASASAVATPINQQNIDNAKDEKRSQHARQIKPGVYVDRFDVIKAFNITCPVQASIMTALIDAADAKSDDAREDALIDMSILSERAIQMHLEDREMK